MSGLADAVAHHRAGRLQQAAAGYVAVLEHDPDNSDALHLLGLVMHRLGHAAEALDLMDRALQQDKRLAPAWANRALVLRALGRDDEAHKSLKRALRLRPDLPEALLNLARLHHDRGDAEASVRAAREAVRLADSDEAAEVLATALASAGDADGAAQALAGHPAHRRLRARLLLAAGRADDAVAELADALRAEPSSRPTAIALCDALSQVDEPPTGLDDVLAAALALEGVDHQRLERALRVALAEARDDPPALAAHPLTVPWLSRTLIQHPDWETAARALRAWVLAHPDEAGPALVEALALHAFHIEHAWPTSDDEHAHLDTLEPDDPLAAMYVPQPGPDPEPGTDIEVVVTSDDATSAAVQAMYEDNPYPRLVSVHLREPVPLQTALADILHAPPAVPDRPLEVLVAGCGTGQHPLQTATAWADVSVLGVDLSRASLVRAARRAEALGVDNVRFAQGDLLALDALEPTFDVVESVGVLHHLADPLRGWRVLRDRLKPGGLMRIGLYSERGRADVVAGRALVQELGLSPTPDGLRAFREAVRALPDDHPAKPLVHSPDFPSLSGVRDLVFHVCEHRFTLPRLSEALDTLGLRFLGFQHNRADVPALYRERWPDDAGQTDLARWEELEAEHPRLFSGMYVFWCSRR